MPRRHVPDTPAVEIRQFGSPQEIERAIPKLRRRIEDVNALDPRQAADPYSADREIVAQGVRATILEVFGQNSLEYQQNQYVQIWEGPARIGMDREDVALGIAAGKAKVIGILEALIPRLEERRGDFEGDATERVHAAFRGLDLHPRIAEVAADLYLDGHYAEAVFEAAKALVNMVKEKSRRDDLDGGQLMSTVFSVNNPVLAFNELKDQTQRDEQQGMMHLFMGAVLGIRNPRGHDFPGDTPERAVEYVALLSLLANRLKETTRRH